MPLKSERHLAVLKTVLFAAGAYDFRERKNAKQIVVGANFLTADDSAGAGASRKSEQYDNKS